MVGRSLDNEFPDETRPVGEVRLEVTNLSRGKAVQDVSFKVHGGEILGVAGLVGQVGLKQFVCSLGYKPDSGAVCLDGEQLQIRHHARDC